MWVFVPTGYFKIFGWRLAVGGRFPRHFEPCDIE